MYKSIKAFLYDRTSSPLFGAFIISWSIINYRVILTIFSGESLANKFEVINTLFQPIDTGFFLVSGALVHGFIYPVIATLSYIYLYPRLAKPVYKHSLKKQIELREVKQEEESNRLLTLEESRDIYREMAEVEEKFNVQQEKHRAQVSGLIAQIKGLEKTDKVDSPNKTSLTEYNIDDKIDQLPEGNFSFEQLMGGENWSGLDDGEKRTLGKMFNKNVKTGGYLGVSYEGEGSNNRAQYVKKDTSKAKSKEQQKLSDLKEKILSVFASSYDKDLTKNDFYNLDHVVKVDLALEDMLNQNYLHKGGYEHLTLKQKGREYIVDNNLLKT